MAKHTAHSHISASARVSAGLEFFDASASTTTAGIVAEGVISASARIKSGRQILIGAACACCGGNATATAQEGGGTFRFIKKEIFGTATASATASIAVNGTGIFRASVTGRATVEAQPSITWLGEACGDRLRGVAFLYAEPYVNAWAKITGRAYAVADYRHIGQSSNTLPPFQVAVASGTAAVQYNSPFGELLGQAFIKAPQLEAAAGLIGKAAAKELSFTYYSNGLLKLKNVSEILQRYLPQYMAEGELIKRIMEVFGSQIQRVIYDRDGYPPDLTDGLVQQFFLDRATWGLKYWEDMAGLPVDENGTDYATRRGLVQAALFGRKRESEYWFKYRLEQLTGDQVIINPQDPAEKPYEIELESNVMLGEPAPNHEPDLAPQSGTGPLTGSYTYKITYLFLTGETDEGDSETPSIIVSGQKIRLSDIPISPTGAIARKIYRRRNPDTDPDSQWHYVDTIPDNETTTYLDGVPDVTVLGQPVISPYNTATTFLGLKFLDLVAKSKPAHLHVAVRSERFRASINAAGDPV